ncbi:hypothetical protein ATEIFO6365_0001037800 [Aspergillus terreus]|uniref:Uncharacterized protein n=1 Tax=Aspergillus terreus TaxID=33178 RepID=A0A5M3YQM9_ASPTE|nr:hypothetical protein ATETN484_0001029900 [Aspergillus terreus]GFF12155.1 hypothetical protein ATEIFO6365_0001037800 [Aspergillus terreus]
MPPLSAYTPFESLLFFQSLAAHDTRPANFLSISDRLRNNPFIRQNVAFDATRLAPEALEDLYTTLMRDGADLESNGGHVDGSNPKKRKIVNVRPEPLGDKGINHATFVPGLVSHLYARYKDLVTREIRNEEKRFKDIRDEIDRLQKEEREALLDSSQSKIVQQKPVPQPSSAKVEAVAESAPMDVDTKRERDVPVQQPLKPASQNPINSTPATDGKRTSIESQPKKLAQEPATPIPRPAAVQVLAQPQQEQASKSQPQTQPPSHPQLPSQPLPPNQTPLYPQHAASSIPHTQTVNGVGTIPPKPIAPRNVPPVQGVAATPAQAVGPGQGPKPSLDRGHVAPPPQTPQAMGIPPSAAVQKPPATARPSGQEPSSMAAPSPAQRPPPQPTFQQWSLNQPQTPRPPHTIPTPATQAPVRPSLPHTPQLAPKTEPKKGPKAPQPTQPTPVPSTPGPAFPDITSPAPSGLTPGFQTPVGPAQSLPLAELRGRPRMSIDTSGSLTPWKRTPQLSIPTSPRSPERPRPEDVSPISETAPSLPGSREPTPEATEPPRKRRRNEAKTAERGRESSFADGETKSGLRGKPERLAVSGSKRRDRSTASSRSRGRSVLSRDDDAEAGPTSKIKHELPSTPAGVPETVETDQRATGRRGVQSPEERSGRGRPKRKRSEAFEPESLTNELGRTDPNQSTPYVLCARNFPRTGAPIMNDVTTHKHASIFTKPLTERDAPGYRDLIYRPQDLKSIKSSIHQGSKAVAAATEAANTPVADGESPAPSKNAVLMLQKTEDVIPPKGIVNSAQLEKELIRMFANAVMFNPVPQRGFGPAFPMTSDGGSRASTQVPEADEGGIIKDTIEMFEDVEQAVTRWRAAERTADELATKSVLSLRRGSASDPNADSADEVKG